LCHNLDLLFFYQILLKLLSCLLLNLVRHPSRNITARSVEVYETNQPNYYNTGIFVGAGRDPRQSGETQGGRGNLTIRANRVSVRGGEISASTQGQGDAGRILIQARDLVEVVDTSETTGRISFISALVSQGATGRGGNIRIETNRLVTQGSQVAASTSGEGDAGNLTIFALDSITLAGERPNVNEAAGGLFARVRETGSGQGGTVRITTGRLDIRDGSQIQVTTLGEGDAGNLIIRANEINVQETSMPNSLPTGIFAGSRIEGESDALPRGAGGTVNIRTNRLNVDGGEISSNTVGRQRAGNIIIRSDALSILNGTISAVTSRQSGGQGGNITINAGDLALGDRASISAQSNGSGRAGNITVNVLRQAQLSNSDIRTSATRASGGAITINAQQIRLNGDSDIQTNVQRGQSGAGDITLNANTPILALDDSDILANADPESGRGGQITLNSPGLFAENYEPAPRGTEQQLDRNNQVDINANAQQPGTVVTPDTSFISNSLTDISEVPIDTDRLLANTCIARTQQPGRFTRPGTDGLPQSPSNATQSAYPTGTIQPIPEAESRRDRPWQMGDAIVEPQGVYRLPDGRLIMGRGCAATD
jgi:large exoprotein involved in heme utilization and adhesion